MKAIDRSIVQYNKIKERIEEQTKALHEVRDQIVKQLERIPYDPKSSATIVDCRPTRVKAHNRAGFRYIRIKR